jgi:hypothetical protein
MAKHVLRPTSLGMGTCGEESQYATCSAVGAAAAYSIMRAIVVLALQKLRQALGCPDRRGAAKP